MKFVHAIRTVALFVTIVVRLTTFPVVMAVHMVADSDVAIHPVAFRPMVVAAGKVTVVVTVLVGVGVGVVA